MNLDKLKSVIQTANHEIMELKFGCEIKYKGKVTNYLGTFTKDHVLYSNDLYLDIHPPVNGNNQVFSGNEECKILGRPIRLADVLCAFNQAKVCVNAKGMFFHVNGLIGEMIDDNVYWNLKDDDLDHQSDETKQFLTELLTSQ